MKRRLDDAGGKLEIRIADFESDNAAIRSVRFAVFVDEQRVPASIEMDDRDPHCIHVLAFLDGAAVATGRVDLSRSDGAAGEVGAKIGRVAVLRQARRRGVGAAVMHALHEIAAGHGASLAWCNAQVAAAAFYERLGYRVTSEPFDEAGIAHVRMQRAIDERARRGGE